jgi:hypothetical protein
VNFLCVLCGKAFQDYHSETLSPLLIIPSHQFRM